MKRYFAAIISAVAAAACVWRARWCRALLRPRRRRSWPSKTRYIGA